jgi:hypothetical protein
MFCKLVVVAVLAMLLELAHDLHTLAVVSGNPLLASFAVASAPFIGFLDAHWFIEAGTIWKRLALVAATAVGYAAGTAVVIRLN